MTIRVTDEAITHLREIRAWWREHGDVAVFDADLDAAVEQLLSAPRSGSPYPRRLGIRRILLRRTRYHLYYSVDGDEVLVRAVWHAVRGRDPAL